VGDADRPVQFVFAGKAHPADTAGQALIAEVVGAAQTLGIADRVVFVEDYDMDLARTLVAGCDVWLNTPVRPLEACGTSGMKAVFNGGLNCSVSDGWWDECHGPDNGWVIASAEHESDPEVRDALERDAVFTMLERDVVSLFAERNSAGIPQQWLAMVRNAMAELCPFLDAARMIDEYTTGYYLPAITGAHNDTTER
jgi:starch phosphorylase